MQGDLRDHIDLTGLWGILFRVLARVLARDGLGMGYGWARDRLGMG